MQLKYSRHSWRIFRAVSRGNRIELHKTWSEEPHVDFSARVVNSVFPGWFDQSTKDSQHHVVRWSRNISSKQANVIWSGTQSSKMAGVEKSFKFPAQALLRSTSTKNNNKRICRSPFVFKILCLLAIKVQENTPPWPFCATLRRFPDKIPIVCGIYGVCEASYQMSALSAGFLSYSD